MKKQLLKFALFLLCICFASCSDDGVLSQVTPKKNFPHPHVNDSILEREALWLERYNQIDVENYLSTWSSLYGSPLVFKAGVNVDSVLETLSEMEYWELREWATDRCFHNDILESNITYDSVYYHVAFERGYDLSDQDGADALYENDKELDLFMKEFSRRMATDYPNACISSVSINPAGDTLYMVRPLGHIDYAALCNDKHLFIVDKVVYKVLNGHLLTCPMDRYEFLCNDTGFPASIADQLSMYEGHVDSLDYCLTPYNNDPIVTDTADIYDDEKTHIRRLGNRTLKLYTTAYPFWLGPYWLKKSSTITNYYNGSEFKASTIGDVSFLVSFVYKNEGNPYSYIWTPSSKIKFKSKTRAFTDCISFYRNTDGYHIGIYPIYINITQDYLLTLTINQQ